MINAAEILDALVAKLRDVPELVDLVDGNPENIAAYHDQYPNKVSLQEALTLLKAPGIMCYWQGAGPTGSGGFEAWQHSFGIALRAAAELNTGATPSGYYQLWKLIMRGVPATDPEQQPLRFATIHPQCLPMTDVPTIRRLTDVAGIDYFEISISFTEIGDE